jgi:glycosyltransferase involved in cell wall biosynthesis
MLSSWRVTTVGAGNLHVLFAVVQSPPSPGPRYRVLQYLPFLESHGIRGTVIAMQGPRSTRRSMRSGSLGPLARLLHYGLTWVESQIFLVTVLGRLHQFDRVYFYRIPVSGWARRLLSRYRDRILVDFDDALDDAEGADGRGLSGLRKGILRRGLHNALGISAVTITSNRRNARLVAGQGHRVEVIPTSVDPERFTFRDRRDTFGPLPVLGWIGTPSTASYLRLIEGALHRIAAVRPVVIRLIGPGRNPFQALPADVVEWNLGTEAEEVRRFDIGLMPMPDTSWTRGKAAAKALLYGASGAPTAASWTPTNVEILGESEGAVFARSEDEWVVALNRLLDDPAMRSTMGQRGFARVAQHYSLSVSAARLLALIRDPYAQQRAPGPGVRSDLDAGA